ncbi:uncharacterized protein LOC118231773 [Anguilla anguilla]|uniref:uncharacterized protein LOC118231773 n=1 Tax=Anguilla anguilla TaxID=7936 RepID=UPI0015A790DC|nr:uncharacterized protein LOC118231773 [Anguilla anguilla]
MRSRHTRRKAPARRQAIFYWSPSHDSRLADMRTDAGQKHRTEETVPETAPMAQAGPSSGTAGTRTGVDTCNSQGCRCCRHIWKGAVKFQSTATGEHYNITQYLTCKTPSVIYIIQCKKCPVQYVGKTLTTLQRTVEEHRASITNQRRQPVPDHFNNNDHCLDHLIVYPIEQVNGSEALKERELYWIRELATMAHGLNCVPYTYEEHRTEETAPETAPVAQAGPSSRTAGTRTGVDTCNSQGCRCCGHIWKGAVKFQSTATGEHYNITQYLTCKTPSVIYIIQCKKCPMQYVGKTTTTLQRRSKDHRSSIRKRQYRPIPVHFNNNGHSLKDLILFPIEQVNGCKALKERELYWITELETMARGLNLVPCNYVGEQQLGDGEERSAGPAQEQVEECKDAIEDGKQAMSQVYTKLKNVTSRERQSMEFLNDLKKKVSDLKEYDQKEKIYIGLFGKTGAGKSSLINAIINEDQLLPSSLSHACTSVLVQVQANTKSRKYKADIEFISPEAKELSRSIECYIRSDEKGKDKFWPLVKRVTISLPQSPALLEGVVLVDLPGAGDVSKHRSEMWKKAIRY